MLRPRVTHSAAQRNIRQKRPWMEYSGTTSWEVRVRGQLPSARPSFKGTEGIWGLEASTLLLGTIRDSNFPIPSQVPKRTKQAL